MKPTTPRRRRRAVIAALAVGATLTVSGGSLAASAAAAPVSLPVDPLALVSNLLAGVLGGVLPSDPDATEALASTASALVPTDVMSKPLGETDPLETLLGAGGSPLDLVGRLLGPTGPLGAGLALLG
ncbi:MAG: hypothetical protein QOK40_973 [Miltoncostaeaceae bacterium]|nr:hypothetical protein [Miltoncostaeaceae bacterium]